MLTRESFFALYWDHCRDFWKEHLCRTAKLSGAYGLLQWDELTEAERPALRKEILEMVEIHEHNRRLALNQAATPAPKRARA